MSIERPRIIRTTGVLSPCHPSVGEAVPGRGIAIKTIARPEAGVVERPRVRSRRRCTCHCQLAPRAPASSLQLLFFCLRAKCTRVDQV